MVKVKKGLGPRMPLGLLHYLELVSGELFMDGLCNFNLLNLGRCGCGGTGKKTFLSFKKFLLKLNHTFKNITSLTTTLLGPVLFHLKGKIQTLKMKDHKEKGEPCWTPINCTLYHSASVRPCPLSDPLYIS